MKLSVIIPVFNEEDTIRDIIARVRAVELPSPLQKEIIVVNDGSTDKTESILKDFSSTPGLIVVHQSNQGKTGALLTGLNHATGDIFLIQDADLEYDPIQYPSLLQPIIEGKSQVVYGSRFLGTIKGMAPINRWANNISNLTINLLYKTQLTDINTCYKVFTRKAFEGISIKGRNFEMDTELTVKFLFKGIPIREVSIQYVARPRRAGKKIKWSTATSMFWKIIQYRLRPSL